MNALALRWAVPAIVIVAIITIAIVAVALLTHTQHPGTAWGFP
jgi:hypothetical protein